MFSSARPAGGAGGGSCARRGASGPREPGSRPAGSLQTRPRTQGTVLSGPVPPAGAQLAQGSGRGAPDPLPLRTALSAPSGSTESVIHVRLFVLRLLGIRAHETTGRGGALLPPGAPKRRRPPSPWLPWAKRGARRGCSAAWTRGPRGPVGEAGSERPRCDGGGGSGGTWVHLWESGKAAKQQGSPVSLGHPPAPTTTPLIPWAPTGLDANGSVRL